MDRRVDLSAGWQDRLVSQIVSLGLFAVAVAAFGVIAVWLGVDGNGDLRNYHYYGGWALTNKVVGFDIAPGQLQTYHHPLLDAMFYRVVRWLNAYPRVFTFVWSMPQAVAVWMMFQVARLAFEFLPRGRDLVAVLAAVIGGTGAASLSTLGMSMSEAVPNVAIWGAVWLVLLADRSGRLGGRMLGRYGAAGLLAGAAAVLKLTAAAYLAGFGGAIVALRVLEPGLPRWRALGVFGAGALVALAALGGPWWLAVYRAFGNPLFPYYNAVFHSPYFPDVNVFDRRFLPQTLGEWVFYPVEWAFWVSRRTTEVGARDPRILLAVGASVCLLGVGGVLRVRGGVGRLGGLLWCAAFTLVAYVLWLRTFSILRYASGLEMGTGIVVLGVLCLVPVGRFGWVRGFGFGVLAAGLIGALVLPRWERQARVGAKVIDVAIPVVPADSTIFLLGEFEGAFMAPFEPRTVRFIGLNNNILHDWRDIGLDGLVARAVAAAGGPLWSLSDQGPPLPGPAERSLGKYGLRSTAECRRVTSTIAPPMTLCRVERIAPG